MLVNPIKTKGPNFSLDFMGKRVTELKVLGVDLETKVSFQSHQIQNWSYFEQPLVKVNDFIFFDNTASPEHPFDLSVLGDQAES